MADDSAVTDRLRQLAEATEDELAGDTIVLDDTDLMATTELRQLLDPAGELITSLGDHLQAMDDGED